MEAPAQLAGVHVVRADVAVHRRFGLGGAQAQNNQVFVDGTRCGQRNDAGGRLVAKILAQVDAAVVAEALDGLPRAWVQRPQRIERVCEEHLVCAIRPEGEATVGLAGVDAAVEAPELLASGRVQRDDLLAGRVSEQGVSYDERVRLEPGGLASVPRPCGAQLGYVGAVDLRQWRVALPGLAAAVDRPVHVAPGRWLRGPQGVVQRQNGSHCQGHRQ